MASESEGKISISNVNHPGKSERVDATKYNAMRSALLKVLPSSAPGATVAELQAKVVSKLPQSLFPGGAKAGWWFKAVQLDLEAKGLVLRSNTKPLRLYRAKQGPLDD